MEIFPSITIIFFFFILQKYVQFFSSSFIWFCIYELFVFIFFFFFFFSLSQALFFYYLRIIKFCISSYNKGFIFFYFQVVFELFLYVHYQIKLIFLNSKIFMLLFLIFIFVVSNIMCVRYKNVIIRQLISQKRIMFFLWQMKYLLLSFHRFLIIKFRNCFI